MLNLPSKLKAMIRAWQSEVGASDDDLLAALGRVIDPNVFKARIAPGAEERAAFTDWTPVHFKNPGGLTAAEEAEKGRLMAAFSRKDLDPAGQQRLVALLDRIEDARLAALKAKRSPFAGVV